VDHPHQPPGLQLRVFINPFHLLFVRKLREPRPELGGLQAFGHDHLLIPVAKIFLHPDDLPVSFPANRASLQKMRNHLLPQLVIRHPSRQKSGQRL
jgi:hypothetical protein